MDNPDLKLPKGVLEFLSRANEQPSKSLFGLAMSDVERQKENDPMYGESVLDMFNRLKKDFGGEIPFLPMYAHEALDREISSAKMGSIFGDDESVKTQKNRLNELLKIKEIYQ